MGLQLSKTKLAVLALILANILWGATSPIFKWSLADIEPFTFGFLRFFFATLILLPFVIHRIKVSLSGFVKLAIISYLGLFLHITYLLFGLKLSESINAPIITSSAPIFLIIGSALFLREKVRKRVAIGTIISLVGVLIIVLLPVLHLQLDATVLGNFFFILTAITGVIYVLLLKKFHLPYSTITITFWLFAITAATYFPFALWETQGSVLSELTPKALLGILYGALFTSVIAYACFNFAVKHLVAHETGIFFYVDPVVAVLIAQPLLGEQITLPYLLGALFVFLGIYIAERRIHFHPIHKLRG